jgi:hypothetical protein
VTIYLYLSSPHTRTVGDDNAAEAVLAMAPPAAASAAAACAGAEVAWRSPGHLRTHKVVCLSVCLSVRLRTHKAVWD